MENCWHFSLCFKCDWIHILYAGADELQNRGTYGEAIAEIVHAVSHDDHPGNAGYPSVLHLLIRVAVSSMRVTVSVRVPVLLGFTAIFLGRGLTEV